jgi:hypothetical protein
MGICVRLGGVGAALAFTVAALGCSSNHHVSPFAVDPTLFLAPRADLDGQLARAMRETSASGLRETQRLEGKLPSGHRFLMLGYEGVGISGTPTHATRVVTPFAVVLAEGPEASPSKPTELLPFVQDGAFPSGLDLTGDGAADVVLRSADGRLAVYRVDGTSAAAYPIVIAAPPRRGRDENGDGLFDLVGVAEISESDPIAPVLTDVAINDGTSFRNDHPDSSAFHERQKRPMLAEPAPPAKRLQRAIENAFHARLSGMSADAAFAEPRALAATLAPLSTELAVSWIRWRGYLADLPVGAGH